MSGEAWPNPRNWPDRSYNRPVGKANAVYPIVGQGQDDLIIAYRQQGPVRLERFLRDVTALADRLPERRYVINLCNDRYRFTVGLVAALCRGQVTLLPQNNTPGAVRSVASDYPETFGLTDGGVHPSIPLVPYPEELGPGSFTGIPLLQAQQRAIIFFTSGSTGRPKPAEKSWGALVLSARAAGCRLDVGRLWGAVVIGTVPHQHSYGLESTIMLALQHGLAIHPSRPFYPADIVRTIQSISVPRVLVTTPIHLGALLAEPDALPAIDLLVSATAPLPATLAVEAEMRFQAPLVEIYGCTEAGQLATRLTAREQDWQWLDGVALEGEGDTSLVSGPYVETPTLLQDVIEPSGLGTFRLRGRVADLVEVAGKHTSLSYLNHQLLGIEGIKDGVFLMPEKQPGQKVARPIAIVVAPGLKPELIMCALRERIDTAFLPRPLIMADKLPRNELGKLPRAMLLGLVEQHRRR